MDSDDLFDELIEFDANVNQTERENHDVSVTRVKGNKQQFNKIDSFMNEHDSMSYAKDEFEYIFKALTAELNALGPPTFTYAEWRLKYSQHKYNRKRKMKLACDTQVEPDTETASSNDENVTPIQGKSDQEVLQKLDIVLSNQRLIFEKLEEIAKK